MGDRVEPARRPRRALSPRAGRETPGAARRRALEVLRDVERGARADAALARRATGLETRDRAFVMELAYGAIRWRGRLDWHLDALLDRGIDSVPADVAAVLRLGAYQLLFMDRVPAWSAVDESVRLVRAELSPSVSGWAAGVVNGVLRNLARCRNALTLPDPADPVLHLAVKHSHPRWLVARWLDRLGLAATEALLVRNNHPPPLHLAVHPQRTTAAAALEAIRSAGRSARPHPLDPEAIVVESGAPDDLPGWLAGHLWAQDVAAQWVVAAAAPRAGERILDACAAPGGKLVGLLARAPGARALALDVDRDRLSRVRENLARLGLAGGWPVAGDARALPTRGGFGYALADVPCTGTGVLRRRVDARWRRRPEDVTAFAAFQREVLSAVAEAVAPGGTLVYATCSLEPEENEEVVAAFLASAPGYRTAPVGKRIPAEHRSGPFLSTRPWTDDLDGMFAARLVREAA